PSATLHFRSAFLLVDSVPSTSTVSLAGQALPYISRPCHLTCMKQAGWSCTHERNGDHVPRPRGHPHQYPDLLAARRSVVLGARRVSRELAPVPAQRSSRSRPVPRGRSRPAVARAPRPLRRRVPPLGEPTGIDRRSAVHRRLPPPGAPRRGRSGGDRRPLP